MEAKNIERWSVKTISMPIEEYEGDIKKARESGYNSGFARGVDEAAMQIEQRVVRPGYADREMQDSGLAKIIKDTAERIKKHFIGLSVGIMRNEDRP